MGADDPVELKDLADELPELAELLLQRLRSIVKEGEANPMMPPKRPRDQYIVNGQFKSGWCSPEDLEANRAASLAGIGRGNFIDE